MLTPTPQSERGQSLDALRGVALLGVLLVNLQTEFRVSLFSFYSHPRSHLGRLDAIADYAIAFLLESKASAVFSFLFGAGMAMFFDRARASGTKWAYLLSMRRLGVLAIFGAFHMLFWNGDILLLYAVAGLLALPVLLLGPVPAFCLALAIGAAYLTGLELPGLPAREVMLKQGVAATRVYGSAGFTDMLAFRWHETCAYILPLLLGALPRVLGLIFAGMGSARFGLLADREPSDQRRPVLAFSCLAIGCIARALELLGVMRQSLSRLASNLANIPFAVGLMALFLWAVARPRLRPILLWWAPLGRMTLTSYLMQSVVLSFVFYGYGLGLMGRLPSAPVAAAGLLLYALQTGASRAWLARFRFGPAEWLWRSLTFGGVPVPAPNVGLQRRDAGD